MKRKAMQVENYFRRDSQRNVIRDIHSEPLKFKVEGYNAAGRTRKLTDDVYYAGDTGGRIPFGAREAIFPIGKRISPPLRSPSRDASES